MRALRALPLFLLPAVLVATAGAARAAEPADPAPQGVIGSLQGVVTLPTQVAPGEPMRMKVNDAAGLPTGGTWSLSGTVVAEEESAEEEDGERRRVALTVPADRAEEVPAEDLSAVAVALAAQGAPEGTWEVVPFDGGEDPALDDGSVDVWTIARDSGGGQGRTLSNATRMSHDAAMNAIRNLKAIAAPPDGEDGRGSAYLVRPARETGGAPAQLVVVEAGAGLAIDEDDGKAASEGGDATPSLTIEPVEAAEMKDGSLLHYFDVSGSPPAGGVTTLFAIVNTTRSHLKTRPASTASAAQDGTVDFVLPADLRPGDTLALRYVDALGELVLDVPEVPGVEVVEPGAGGGPRITDASPRAFPGRLACVCGSFPSPEAWDGVLLDGAALGAPEAASSRMVWVQIPASTAPGEHVFSGAPAPGFPPEDKAATLVLQVGGQIDSTKLQRLESTPMRLRVQGTEEPIELRVRNRTPSIISIEGGDDQVIRTTGGSPNQLERTVRGISPGAFDIQYELAGEPCPCAPSSE